MSNLEYKYTIHMNKVLQKIAINRTTDKAQFKEDILRQFVDLMRIAFLRELSETIILVTILLCITAVLGLIGNCILILVLIKQIRMRTNHSTNLSSIILVLSLALVDLLVCLVSVPTSLIVELWRLPTYDIACKVVMAFRCFLLIFSPMLLVLIALDRFLIICFVPSKKMTLRQTLFVIGFMFLISISISIPSGLCTGVTVYLSPNSNFSHLVNEFIKYNYSSLNSTTDLPNDSVIKLEFTYCHVDKSIIVLPLFDIYRKLIVILFFILLFFLLVFYSGIFGFIWYRHCYWFKKYGKSTIESSSRSQISEKSSSYNSQIRRKTRSSRCIDLDSNSFLSTPTASSRRMSNLRSITSYRRESTFSNSYNASFYNNSQHFQYLHPVGYDYDSKLIEDPEECKIDKEIPLEPLQKKRNSTTSSFIRRKSQVLVSAIQNRDLLSTTNRECKKRRPGSSKTAKTLLIVTLAFAFSYAPFLIVSSGIFSWLDDDIDNNDTNYQKLQIKLLLFFSFHMSGAVNPFIYILMNKSFRSDMCKGFAWLKNIIVK